MSLERHRLIWLFLKNKTNFFTDPLKVLHIAPEYCLRKEFKRMKHLDYVTGDLVSPLADIKFDIHEIPMQDNEFDVIFCNHVLEHVEDDRVAMKELFRVMKPGGWGIFLIPLFYPLPEKTIEDPSITDPKERERLFGQDDHVRMYGMDYIDRLKESGFNVKAEKYAKELTEEENRKYALLQEEIIFYCEKPLA